MNTKDFTKEYIKRKKTIIKLHEQGKSINDIKKLTNTESTVIKRIIQKNESIENSGIFNVNKHDCWLMPSSYTY